MDWQDATWEDYHAWMNEKRVDRPLATHLAARAAMTLAAAWERRTGDSEAFFSDPALHETLIGFLSEKQSTLKDDKMFTKIGRVFKPRDRVLDYGAGIGTYSLAAAEKGCIVEACEINEKLRQYMLWRSKRHSIPMSIIGKPYGGKYDAVMCLNVAQYVEDPVELVLELQDLLDRGGRLILTHQFDNGIVDRPERDHRDFLSSLNGFFHTIDLGWPTVYERR